MPPFKLVDIMCLLLAVASSGMNYSEKAWLSKSNDTVKKIALTGKCESTWASAHASLPNVSSSEAVDLGSREADNSTNSTLDSSMNSYSWFVHVGYYLWGCISQECNHSEIQWICSGALIGPRHVITVAQCFDGLEGESFAVKFPTLSRKYGASSLHIHPSQTLAIIILKDSLADQTSVTPINLLASQNLEELIGHRVYETFLREKNETFSEYSQFFTAETTVIDKDMCKDLIDCVRASLGTPVIVPRTVLCGVPDSVEVSNCSIVSGGTVVIEYNQKPLLVAMKMSDPLCLFLTNVYFPFHLYRTWILSYLNFYQTSTGF